MIKCLPSTGEALGSIPSNKHNWLTASYTVAVVGWSGLDQMAQCHSPEVRCVAQAALVELCIIYFFPLSHCSRLSKEFYLMHTQKF